MAEILIVDDERAIREGMKAVLSGEGFEVRTARDGEDALRRIDEKRPDLVLLDVMMPKMNGFRACEEIRRRDALLPVIFLTAKATEADQVRGIGLGADDYLPKAEGEAILIARVRRALERARMIDDRLARRTARAIRIGEVTVDPDGLTVSDARGEIARLTKTEADILRLLDSERGRLFVLDDIITELRGNGFACEDAMVYTHVHNLRRKLGTAAEKLVNTRGVGYSLAR